ncbi:S8 family serine peptidase [Myxococcus stipitatus]|nr:S8 family peptidase [Myxococcus stipitatus]MCE9668430.1 S8 family serine peptidase [Myxococcus stipitatus]
MLVRFHGAAQAMGQGGVSAVLKGSRVLHSFRKTPGLQHVRLPEGLGVEEAVKRLQADPRVAFAGPNHVFTHQSLPDAARLREQWGLHNTGQTLGVVDADLNAPEAWESLGDGEGAVVAVLDSGVDFTHPDLADNMWTNPGEVAGNGVDDDGNGYVDDLHGIDATDETGSKTPMDTNGHGTHVAGIIAARGGPGGGVSGVSPRAKLIACKMEDAQGSLTEAGAIRCFDYLLDLKTRAQHAVNVVAANASWAGWIAGSEMEKAIARNMEAGILVVAGAGNDGLNLDEIRGRVIPAEFPLPNVISVGAVDASDRRASFSNFGAQEVDVFAPGVDILSTVPGGGYAIYNGTSMAAPHVTGLVALLAAQAPERDWRTLRNLVLAGGRPVPGLRNMSVTGRGVRAIGASGVGSMSCADQTVVRRLEPRGQVVYSGMDRNESGNHVTFSALNIRCGEPGGPVTVQLSAEPWSLTLLDDGQGADRVANDGIATARWVHPGEGTVTAVFPGEDSFVMHDRYARLPVPTSAYARWFSGLKDRTLFVIDFYTTNRSPGSAGPWTVQWDLDFDGRFDVDLTEEIPARSEPQVEVAYSIDVPHLDPSAVPNPAARIIDAEGNASRIITAAIDYRGAAAYPVVLQPTVLVPEVRHPFEFRGVFRYNLSRSPWVVRWDWDYDGVSFRPTTETLVETGDSTRGLAAFSATRTFTETGPRRVAYQVVDAVGTASTLETWGAVVACGRPFTRDVRAEASSWAEPATVSLRVDAQQGCEPILRYHWDFDMDGHFDAVTSEPAVSHLYADDGEGDAPVRSLVRVEAESGRFFDQSFDIPVENAPPRVEPVPEQRVTAAKPMSYQLQASDPGGDALSYFLAEYQPWVSVNDSGLLTWTAPMSWLVAPGQPNLTVNVVVRDDEGARVTVPVVLVPAYERPTPPPTEEPRESSGCSSTGGLSLTALVSLSLLLRRRREARARA